MPDQQHPIRGRGVTNALPAASAAELTHGQLNINTRLSLSSLGQQMDDIITASKQRHQAVACPAPPARDLKSLAEKRRRVQEKLRRKLAAHPGKETASSLTRLPQLALDTLQFGSSCHTGLATGDVKPLQHVPSSGLP